MKAFGIFVVAVVLAAQVQSRPQYGSGGGGDEPECITKFREVDDIENKEEFRKICNPVTKAVCVTKYRKDCIDVTSQECKTEYRKDCQTLYRDKCFDDYRDASEPYTEDECRTEYVPVCEKGWVEQGYNDKVWADIPETCKDLPKTVCVPVNKVRTVKEKYTKCDKEPYEDCKEVPEEKCIPVVNQKCKDVPYEDCRDETTQVCEDKHFQVPTPIKRKVSVRVCKDASGKFPEDGPLIPGTGDVEIIPAVTVPPVTNPVGIRSGNTDDAGNDDPDKIVFG